MPPLCSLRRAPDVLPADDADRLQAGVHIHDAPGTGHENEQALRNDDHRWPCECLMCSVQVFTVCQAGRGGNRGFRISV